MGKKKLRAFKDEDFFCDIPARKKEEGSGFACGFACDYDILLRKEMKEAASFTFEYLTHEGDDEESKKQSAAASAEWEMKSRMNQVFKDIIGNLRTIPKDRPYRIGAFPESRQKVLRYGPEGTEEADMKDAEFDIFQYEITQKNEKDILPEMVRLRESNARLNEPYRTIVAMSTICLLFSLAVLLGMYRWQQAGYPILFAEQLAARGWGEEAIAQSVIAPGWIFGAILPAIAFRGILMRSGIIRTCTTSIFLGILMTIILGFCGATEAGSSFRGTRVQTLSNKIFLGYFALIAVIFALIWLYSLWAGLEHWINKKRLIQSYLNTMDTDGRMVYFVIRLMTLWQKYETGISDPPPHVISSLAADFQKLYDEALKYSR